jgi:hypothetical protein
MKKYLLTGIAAVLAIGMLYVVAAAQDTNSSRARHPAVDAAPPAEATPDQAETQPQQRPDQYRRIAQKLIDELGLSDAQAEKLRTALHDFAAQRQANRQTAAGKLHDLEEQLSKATQAGDKDQAAKLRAEMQTTRQDLREENHEELLAAMKGVLTAEQIDRARMILSPRPAHRLARTLEVLRTLPLQDDQVKKVGEILDGANDKVLAVLTDQQRAELEKRIEARAHRATTGEAGPEGRPLRRDRQAEPNNTGGDSGNGSL